MPASRSDILNERVAEARHDREAVNGLIEEYMPFIASCAEKSSGRYMRYGSDDELSIALMAFAEAIESYDKTKGSFLGFAQGVIKRRLIDYFRKNSREARFAPLQQTAADNGESSAGDSGESEFSTAEAIDRYKREELTEYRRLEIIDFKRELEEWGISIKSLVAVSPKHAKTRNMAEKILGFILSKPEAVADIRQKREIPISELERNLGIPRKKIERMRKYILAVMIIKTGDYTYLGEYVRPADKSGAGKE